MDLQKMGSFIASCRKQQNMTQQQLAEKLAVTNQAVSKWETGKGAPDSAIMLQLCQALQISVTDLLCGEKVTVENQNKELERQLLELVKQKEQSDKRLLQLEIVVGVLSLIVLMVPVLVGAYVPMEEWLRPIIVFSGFAPGLVGFCFAMKIEQVAGYYECGCCQHRYVPGLKAVWLAPHMGRTRRMRCPKCGRRSWQKKVLTKE